MFRLWMLTPLLGACEFFDTATTDGELTTSEVTVYSGSNTGIAKVPVDVGPDTVSFLVTGQANTYVALEGIYDPDGDQVLSYADWDGARSLTGAFSIGGDDTVVQWPVREQDGRLDPGEWTVEIGTYEAQGQDLFYSPDVRLDATVQTKADGDLGNGIVHVNLVYCQGVDQDAAAVSGLEGAVERWREVWGAYGIELDESYSNSNIGTDLDYPGYGMGDDYANVSAQGDNKDLTILIGETIDGSQMYYGVTGSIPDSLISTERAVIVISWLANSGADGQFSQADIDLFGETLAHETGHYMGLFHPVEDGWQYYDALDDTEECANTSTCQNQLGENLMFPYPVCDFQSCVPQDDLTGDQQGVKHRYTGTL